MKRFLRTIGICAAVAMVLAIGMEIAGEAIPNSYTYKREYMETHGSEIKTLILGSSNAYDGLNPSELPAAFNLANSSQTLEDDYRLLAKYIDGMDSLETVILGLGYHSLGEAQETHRKTYYTIYMDLYPRWPLNRNSLEIMDLRLLTKKIIKYIVSRDVTRCDSLGQRLGHTRAAAEEKREFWNKSAEELARLDQSPISNLQCPISNIQSQMSAIADLCQAHGVTPVVVQMPVMKEYKEALPKEQVALQDSVLRALEGKAVYIDASEWEIPEDGWYNATHLTREASVDFTQRVRDTISR